MKEGEEIAATEKDDEGKKQGTLQGEVREVLLPLIPPYRDPPIFVNLKHLIMLNHRWP